MSARLARLFSLLAFAALTAAAATQRDGAPLALHLLDYIAVDYAGAVANGAVKSEDEYREMTEFSAQAASLVATLPPVPEQAEIGARAITLQALIARKAPATEVAKSARELASLIVKAHGVVTKPRKEPDRVRGAALYAEQCASCHGAAGLGDGPAARGMEPPPANFHDRDRMAGRGLFEVYNTVTLGVKGTAMPAFDKLGDDDRWALAAHVLAFSSPPAAGGGGARADGLSVARARLDASLEAYRRGEAKEAGTLALEAYLEGFELVERTLATVDANLVPRIERAMMDHRRALAAGASAAEIERQVIEIRKLLDEARERLSGDTMSAGAIFSAALLILLREGLEAVLVLAAIFAFLRRAGRDDARLWVHAGWIGALMLGVATWLISERLIAISGANREITEGVTALISAAMLLYVGFWLHDKTHAQAWQGFIRGRVGGALDSGTVATLATVSFLAVYREVFETVLFYQALSAQAGPEGHAALAGGVAMGLAMLVALAAVILRFSARLPIAAFFRWSAILLALLAVIFTGQGIAALQEAGWIVADPLGSVRIAWLGLFPTRQTLGGQVAVAALIVVTLAWMRHRERTS